MAEALEMVQETLRKMKGFQALIVLDQDKRDEVIEAERQAEEVAKEGGLMKVVNEGFWATFGREFQIIVVLDHRSEIIPQTNELLQLKDQEGKKIGEWVGGKTVREPSKGGTVHSTRGDFMLYDGVKIKGEPYFAVPEIAFLYLEGMKGIQNVISCSPAKQVDDLIREWTGLDYEGLFSRIVGFDIDRDDLD